MGGNDDDDGEERRANGNGVALTFGGEHGTLADDLAAPGEVPDAESSATDLGDAEDAGQRAGLGADGESSGQPRFSWLAFDFRRGRRRWPLASGG